MQLGTKPSFVFLLYNELNGRESFFNKQYR
jgi:hypothetical protein